MNRLELLAAINAKKQEVIDLVNAEKLDEAKEAKNALQEMQDKFDLLEGMVNELPEDVKEIKNMGMEGKKIDAIHEFANAARHLFKNMASEGVPADGGYTVPADIQTRINKYKEAQFSLKSLVSVEPVSTMSGRRIYQTKANHTGFSSVAEAGKIGPKATPTFTPINYTIEKYAGYLPVTNELLADSDANIAQVLIEWLGDEEIATENAQILAVIQPASGDTNFANLDGLKTAINVTLGQAYAGSAAIITNDDGFNYLDTLKTTTGEYLLKPNQNQASPIPYVLAVGARLVPVVVVPNSVLATFKINTDDCMPFVVGDLREAIKFFDRQQLSIMTSNTATVSITDEDDNIIPLSAFESDLTLFRGITRFDVVTKDSAAFVKGYVKKA
ncbi:MAG: phage major capsid protein [Eubacterium sp.]|nr:phage major capsid protein [Candidatus Colimonas fimequi]